MPTQKSLVLPVKQGSWEICETDIPTPGPLDVLVKIISTGLNPIDWKIQTYGLYITDFPFVSGTDAAGIVEEVGSDVSNISKGDKILFQGWFENPKATFQQYAIVPAEITAKIPENISFDQAASIPSGLATVATGLWNKDPKAQSGGFPAPWEAGGETKFAGKPAFILGGSSSVGQYAREAAEVLPDYRYRVTAQRDPPHLAPGGVLVLVLPEEIPKEIKADADGKKINRKIGVEVYSRLTEWLKDGVIVPSKVEVLPNGLAGIPDGLNRLKENKVSGTKLIARPQETA